jgi:hypothetical protein
MARLIILLLAMLAGLPATAQVVRVEATGTAFVTHAQDHDAARRRAVADALVAAALAGGAQINGYSVLSQARITADVAMVQFAGRVLSHQILAAERLGDQWQVRIRADVGPASAGPCTPGRRLTVTALPPRFDLRPDVPAWGDALARQLALDVMRTIAAHPAITLDGVRADRIAAAPADLDYAALMAGLAPPSPANHRMVLDIALIRHGGQVQLTLDLGFAGPDGSWTTQRFQRAANLPQAGAVGFLTGQTPDRAAYHLTRDLPTEVTNALSALACDAPTARIAIGQSGPEVPLGAAHGIRRGMLALVGAGQDPFAIYEIAQLYDRRSVLRPLDPARSPATDHGALVYFIEAGL